jgi:predicted nucleic acid-binding protein
VSDTAPIVVLDASVGVKWFRPEAGSDQALALLEAHRDGELRLVVPSIFSHELVAVAMRAADAALARDVWTNVRAASLFEVELDDTVTQAALAVCERTGCAFYDALAPAVAELLDARLCSADRRAHGRYPGVQLIG